MHFQYLAIILAISGTNALNKDFHTESLDFFTNLIKDQK